jgi:hydrogenase maturation protease
MNLTDRDPVPRTLPAPAAAEARPAGLRTVVLGIGNTLLTDEGVGVHVVESLRRSYAGRDDVVLVDGGTLSFTLAGELHGAGRLIVVDAAQLNAAAGTVEVRVGGAMDRFLTEKRTRSVHEVGLADLLQIAALDGGLPRQRALVAIQPQRVDWGELPTPVVAAALPAARDAVRRLIEAWPE